MKNNVITKEYLIKIGELTEDDWSLIDHKSTSFSIKAPFKDFELYEKYWIEGFNNVGWVIEDYYKLSNDDTYNNFEMAMAQDKEEDEAVFFFIRSDSIDGRTHNFMIEDCYEKMSLKKKEFDDCENEIINPLDWAFNQGIETALREFEIYWSYKDEI